jgi:hypothetical protein
MNMTISGAGARSWMGMVAHIGDFENMKLG